ncbi:MAG: CHAT domain-containing protein [Ilumatobacteraceae bacterium]
MPTYRYDDFRIDFSPRPDGAFDVVAHAPDGTDHRSTFVVPLPMATLQETIVAMAKSRSRAADPRAYTTREVAPSISTDGDDGQHEDQVNAETLGAALADALFANGVGVAYDEARQASTSSQRGLRLTLSLGAAPELMSIPWEFLYRRPRFIASQRHTPLVRCLDQGSMVAPTEITTTVRILGVVASPADLTPIDVDAERGHVEAAVAKMVKAGRVELEWLEPATPSSLRKALRDETYHIVHYVGHSSFTNAGEGAIYLVDDDGSAVAVDETMLANLLSDQSGLRLVVLNSCEGARTTLDDPYAGVATTLIQLGVPAVVAMQFEITDRAAILFADELYTNLIGRQDPIDAAVGEARKAIYVEIDRIEWATPVLFLRDPEILLFDFKLPEVPLPPPPPPDLTAARTEVDTTKTAHTPSEVERPKATAEQPNPGLAMATAPPTTPPPPTRITGTSRGKTLLAVGIGAALLLGIGAVLLRQASDDPGTAPDPTSPSISLTEPGAETLPATPAPASTVAGDGTLVPRARTGFLSVQIRESGGDTHLYPIDLTTNQVGIITDKRGATDTQGVWDQTTNRVAFTRQRDGDGPGAAIFYVVPGNFRGDNGKQVAPLIPSEGGEFEHFPAWAADDSLYYLRTEGCAPSPDCAERLFRATFDIATDSAGFRDALTFASEQGVESFVGVRAVAADPNNADRIAVIDAEGVWLVDGAKQQSGMLGEGGSATSLAFTGDGRFIVALADSTQGQALSILSTEDGAIQSWLIADVDPDRRQTYLSITADGSGRDIMLLSVQADGSSTVTLTTVEILDDGSFNVVGVSDNAAISALGTAQAIAL